MKLIIFFILLLISCDNTEKKPKEAIGLYTWTETPKKIKDEEFAIINLGDLELSINPEIEETKESIQKKSEKIKVGGLEVLEKYLSSIHQTYGDKAVFVSPGNILNPKEDLSAQINLLKKYSVIINIGPNELALIDNDNVKDLNLISSNMLVMNKKILNIPTYIEKEIAGKKVGFIGLTDDSLVNDNKFDFHFTSFSKTLSKTLYKAHYKRADLIIILVYTKVDCGQNIARKKGLSPLAIGFDAKEKFCQDNSSVLELTKLLPNNTVDAFVVGGPGSKVNHYLNNILVLKNPEKKKYISKIIFSTENTGDHRIFNPVKLCHLFFKDSQDCFQEDSSVDHKKLSPVKFFGRLLK